MREGDRERERRSKGKNKDRGKERKKGGWGSKQEMWREREAEEPLSKCHATSATGPHPVSQGSESCRLSPNKVLLVVHAQRVVVEEDVGGGVVVPVQLSRKRVSTEVRGEDLRVDVIPGL